MYKVVVTKIQSDFPQNLEDQLKIGNDEHVELLDATKVLQASLLALNDRGWEVEPNAAGMEPSPEVKSSWYVYTDAMGETFDAWVEVHEVKKSSNFPPTEDDKDTRIPAWDPIIPFIVQAAKWWEARPEHHWPALVDEGADKVLGMAKAYQAQHNMEEYFVVIAEKLKMYAIEAYVGGRGTPGAPPLLEIKMGTDEYDYAHLGFDEASEDEDEITLSGGLTFLGERGEWGTESLEQYMDFINFPNMLQMDTVVAGIVYFHNKFKVSDEVPTKEDSR